MQSEEEYQAAKAASEAEAKATFREKLRSLQFPRQPYVEQRDENGSSQTYHSSGRVDADVHVAAPVQGLAHTNSLKEVD